MTRSADDLRDRELCRLVELDPTDDAAIVVYADWLEERGDPRATFLRLQQQLRGLKVSHPKLLERGRALFELGKTLPPEWIECVSHPKLAATAWDGRDDDGPLVWRFLANGFVNYTQPSGTYENGRWEQIGITVAMDTNAHYADYFGVIVGDVIRGNAGNINDHKWKWKVKLTATQKTRTPRKKVTAKATAKRKPAKPLPRKTPPKPKTGPVAKASPKRRSPRQKR